MIDADEECDDANLRDGDGCSSTCEAEQAPDLGFHCVEVFEADELSPSTLVATADGVVLVGGAIASSGSDRHAWIGVFDTEGNQLWSREYADASDVWQLRGSGGGFIALFVGPDDRISSLDAQGNINTETFVPSDVGAPFAMLETDAGLLLAGAVYSGAESRNDLWLGRLGPDGEIETLLTRDHAGLDDRFIALERSGDTIAALGHVGLIARSGADITAGDVEGSILFELDEQGQEIRNTLLSSDDEMTSWYAEDLAVSNDGTWVVAGQRDNREDLTGLQYAWGVGLRGGEVAWTHTVESPDAAGLNHANFVAVEAADEVIFVGALEHDDGFMKLSSRLDARDGTLILQSAEVIGEGFGFSKGSSQIGSTAWFIGLSNEMGSTVQWLCDVKL